jgi:hypothetical protein
MVPWKYLWRTAQHALARRTPRNQPPLEHTTIKTHTHKTHKTKNSIQHGHHEPSKLPDSNGSNFTGECNCRTLRNQSWSLQHGDVLFIDDTTCPFIYLPIILCSGSARSLTKGEFLKIHLMIFCAAASKQRALTLSIRRYLIWQCRRRTHLVLAWFWTGGGGHHCQDVFSNLLSLCLSHFLVITKMCPVTTDFNRLSPMYSYVDHHIKMSASLHFFLCFWLATGFKQWWRPCDSTWTILPTW